MDRMHPRRLERGQVLVLMAGALVAMFVMVALIVDGGNAYAQHRSVQNATDAAADAGATVLSVNISTNTKSDADVASAVNRAATDNALTSVVAYYTDFSGNMLTAAGTTTTDTASAVRVGSAPGGAIPPCNANCIGGRATGVRALGARTFATFIARVAGFTDFTASADATARSGYLPGVCDSDTGCVLLPVTFNINQTFCLGNGDVSDTGIPWTIPTPRNASLPDFDSRNEQILTLCKNGPGAVGWLDFPDSVAKNLSQQITNPQQGEVVLPEWFQTQPGNPNNLDTELSEYWGNTVGTFEPGLDQVVLIPMFDGTCFSPSDADDSTPPICTKPANGNNTWYHIPFFAGFALDRTYTQGNNSPECNAAPGLPFSEGTGGTGCFKGWFRHTAGPGPVVINPGAGPGSPTGVQLIK